MPREVGMRKTSRRARVAVGHNIKTHPSRGGYEKNVENGACVAVVGHNIQKPTPREVGVRNSRQLWLGLVISETLL